MANYIKEMRELVGHIPLRIAGASVIVYHDKKILLQLRDDTKLWCYPGGCIELCETAENAAKREFFEETGLTANNLEFFRVFSGPGYNYTYPNGDIVDIIEVMYICTSFSGTLPKSTDESLELKWFDINSIPSIEKIHPPAIPSLIEVIEYLKKK